MGVPPDRVYLLWLGLLGLVVILVAAMTAEALRMERSITRQAEAAIAAAGYSRVRADARGRDVRLTGQVSSVVDKQRLERIVSKLDGVRTVDSIVSLEVIKLPWLRITTDDRGARLLSGRVPRQIHLDQVMALLAANDMVVTSRVEIDPEVGMPAWLPLMRPLLGMAGALDRYRMEIGGGEVMIGGRTSSAGTFGQSLEVLREKADLISMQLRNRIAVLPG